MSWLSYANINKKHIRFDEDLPLKSSQQSSQPQQSGQNGSASAVPPKTRTINMCLVKNRTRGDKSFGFELKGHSNSPGDHFVDVVEANSPAERAGLRHMDKITHVNGTQAEKYTINSLFDLLEYETNLNENKLNLIVSRAFGQDQMNEAKADTFQNVSTKRCKILVNFIIFMSHKFVRKSSYF
jgi:predicted metalloprotease with PDZ domain